MTNQDCQWSCGTCTFLNPMQRMVCEMCDSPKPPAAPVLRLSPTKMKDVNGFTNNASSVPSGSASSSSAAPVVSASGSGIDAVPALGKAPASSSSTVAASRSPIPKGAAHVSPTVGMPTIPSAALQPTAAGRVGISAEERRKREEEQAAKRRKQAEQVALEKRRFEQDRIDHSAYSTPHAAIAASSAATAAAQQQALKPPKVEDAKRSVRLQIRSELKGTTLNTTAYVGANTLKDVFDYAIDALRQQALNRPEFASNVDPAFRERTMRMIEEARAQNASTGSAPTGMRLAYPPFTKFEADVLEQTTLATAGLVPSGILVLCDKPPAPANGNSPQSGAREAEPTRRDRHRYGDGDSDDSMGEDSEGDGTPASYPGGDPMSIFGSRLVGRPGAFGGAPIGAGSGRPGRQNAVQQPGLFAGGGMTLGGGSGGSNLLAAGAGNTLGTGNTFGTGNTLASGNTLGGGSSGSILLTGGNALSSGNTANPANPLTGTTPNAASSTAAASANPTIGASSSAAASSPAPSPTTNPKNTLVNPAPPAKQLTCHKREKEKAEVLARAQADRADYEERELRKRQASEAKKQAAEAKTPTRQIDEEKRKLLEARAKAAEARLAGASSTAANTAGNTIGSSKADDVIMLHDETSEGDVIVIPDTQGTPRDAAVFTPETETARIQLSYKSFKKANQFGSNMTLYDVLCWGKAEDPNSFKDLDLTTFNSAIFIPTEEEPDITQCHLVLAYPPRTEFGDLSVPISTYPDLKRSAALVVRRSAVPKEQEAKKIEIKPAAPEVVASFKKTSTIAGSSGPASSSAASSSAAASSSSGPGLSLAEREARKLEMQRKQEERTAERNRILQESKAQQTFREAKTIVDVKYETPAPSGLMRNNRNAPPPGPAASGGPFGRADPSRNDPLRNLNGVPEEPAGPFGGAGRALNSEVIDLTEVSSPEHADATEVIDVENLLPDAGNIGNQPASSSSSSSAQAIGSFEPRLGASSSATASSSVRPNLLSQESGRSANPRLRIRLPDGHVENSQAFDPGSGAGTIPLISLIESVFPSVMDPEVSQTYSYVITSTIPRQNISVTDLRKPLSEFSGIYPSGGTILILERSRAETDMRAGSLGEWNTFRMNARGPSWAPGIIGRGAWGGRPPRQPRRPRSPGSDDILGSSTDDDEDYSSNVVDPFSLDEMSSAYPQPRVRSDQQLDRLRNRLGQETFNETVDLTTDDPNAGQAENCAICQCPFQNGDDIRRLPCMHRFHTECVEQGLRYSTKCAICKYDLATGQMDSAASD